MLGVRGKQCRPAGKAATPFDGESGQSPFCRVLSVPHRQCCCSRCRCRCRCRSHCHCSSVRAQRRHALRSLRQGRGAGQADAQQAGAAGTNYRTRPKGPLLGYHLRYHPPMACLHAASNGLRYGREACMGQRSSVGWRIQQPSQASGRDRRGGGATAGGPPPVANLACSPRP